MRRDIVRRSIRLRGFDYRRDGAYFVTICTYRRACLLGEIHRDRVVLSDAGVLVERTWGSIPEHRPHVRLDAFVVILNHVHGILILEGVGAKHASPLRKGARGTQPGSLSAVVQAFKSASTRALNLARRTLGQPLWQRGFYDRVIRDEEEWNRMRGYIEENPLKWALDRENPLHRGT